MKFTATLTLARQDGHRHPLGIALLGLARRRVRTGDRAAARSAAHHALTILTELGVPEAGEAADVTAVLAATGGP